MAKILEELKGARTVAISGHVRPDGDCIGSCMGLYLYLKKALPEVRTDIYLEQPSRIFSCIDRIEEVKTDCGEDIVYDAFIAVDTASDRLGAAEKYFKTAKRTINVDHHISNAKGCGQINHVDAAASSASELVYDLMEEELVDASIAKAIYIGIIHDTGVFQYSNTSPRTLMTAAKLISYGFDFSRLIDETF